MSKGRVGATSFPGPTPLSTWRTDASVRHVESGVGPGNEVGVGALFESRQLKVFKTLFKGRHT